MKTTRRSLLIMLSGLIAWFKAPALKAEPTPIEVISSIPGVVKPEDCKVWAYSARLYECPVPEDGEGWLYIFHGDAGVDWALNFWPRPGWEPPDLQHYRPAAKTHYVAVYDAHMVYRMIRRGAVEYLKEASEQNYVSSLPIEMRPLYVEYRYPKTIVKQALGIASASKDAAGMSSTSSSSTVLPSVSFQRRRRLSSHREDYPVDVQRNAAELWEFVERPHYKGIPNHLIISKEEAQDRGLEIAEGSALRME